MYNADVWRDALQKKKIKDSLLVILQHGACQVPMENLRYVKLYKHL